MLRQIIEKTKTVERHVTVEDVSSDFYNHLSEISIDAVFKKHVTDHYLLNLAHMRWASPIMAIEGPSGEGKTIQLEATLWQAGIPYRKLNASELSGRHEGDSLTALATAYQTLSNESSTNKIGCLIIDDFDLSPAGQREKTEYSVNSQLLTALLMQIADDPTLCQGHRVRRNAIFLTGNNFSLIHRPLTRKGRCRVFTWQPDEAQKKVILQSILKTAGVKHATDIAHQAVAHDPALPIATYRAAIEYCCVDAIQTTQVSVSSTSRKRLEKTINNALKKMSFASFMKGVERAKIQGGVNFLEALHG